MSKNLFPAFALATAIGLTIVGAAGGAQALPVGVTSSGALSTIDTYSWDQLGADSVLLSSPQAILSAAGASASLSSAGGTLTPRTQGSSWNGNFAPNARVLWDAGVGPDYTFTLTAPVSGFGAQIEQDNFGAFTAKVTAFDSANNVLGSFTEDGISTNAGDNSAIFIGLKDAVADISKFQFLLTSGSGPSSFAISALDVTTDPSAVPLPGTLGMFALALLGISGWSRFRRKAATA
ncbi:MAG: hypothetical protein M3N08_03690 [Pseudomonadota bacterium]|nr:hypothetical protein [Pseudomonadota bacterium]